MPFRQTAIFIVLLVCAACAGGCMPPAQAAPIAVQVAAPSYWASPATLWDICKTIFPFFLAVVAWAWRVESRLIRHDSALDKLTTTLDRIEHTLESWADVKEERAERLARLEAKIDLLMTSTAFREADRR